MYLFWNYVLISSYFEQQYSFLHQFSQWTDEKNSLHERKSLLHVKVNLDHSCLEIHRAILMNMELMENNIASGEKYGTK